MENFDQASVTLKEKEIDWAWSEAGSSSRTANIMAADSHGKKGHTRDPSSILDLRGYRRKKRQKTRGKEKKWWGQKIPAERPCNDESLPRKVTINRSRGNIGVAP